MHIIGFWRTVPLCAFSAVVLYFQTIPRRCPAVSLGDAAMEGMTAMQCFCGFCRRGALAVGVEVAAVVLVSPGHQQAQLLWLHGGFLCPWRHSGLLTPLCSRAVDPWCLCRARYMSLLLSMQYVDHFGQ